MNRVHGYYHALLNIIMLLCCSILIGCAPNYATQNNNIPPVIGPYAGFSARLLVIEPTRRWQVMVNWSGDANEGQARFTHAASNRVLLVHWLGGTTEMLDNQDPEHVWKPISSSELAKQGMIIAPSILASILHNNIPSSFKYIGKGRWQGSASMKGIAMFWRSEAEILKISNLSRGREITLMIQPSS